MGKMTYNLGICVQAHDNRLARVRQVRQNIKTTKPHQLLALSDRDRDLRQMCVLMSCVYPNAKDPHLMNGDSIMRSSTTRFNHTHADLASTFLQREERILANEPVTFVGEEVCDLLQVAVGKMEADVLHPSDLIAPQGFIYLSKPIYLPDFHPETGEYDERLQSAVRGIIWHQEKIGLAYDDQVFGEGVVLTLLTDNGISRHVVLPGLKEVWEAEKDTPFEGYEALGPDFSLFPQDQHAWAFGIPWIVSPDMTAKDMMTRDDATVVPSPVADIRKWFLAFMRFCWQELIVPRKPTNLDIPRQQRRAWERNNTSSDIHVMYLRRLHTVTDEPSTLGHSLTYRLLVRGHWRNQHYPTLGVVGDPMAYRRIWIEPHVRGPEHAPFKEAKKITAVVR